MNRNDWQKECDFINSVTPDELLTTFNNDVACFNRYIEMQAAQCEKSGYPDIAKDMRLSICY